MRDTGLRPYDILRSATSNPGEYLRDRDRFGTVEVGARADLVLLEANPLTDLDNLRRLGGVMVRGSWLAKSVIDERLAMIAKSYDSQ